MLRESERLQHPWIKVVPHMVDTGLLACAIFLCVQSQQFPFIQPWLTAKVLILMLYIIAGSLALKRGKNKTTKTLAFTFALFCYGFIISIALTRQAQGAFLWFFN